MVVCNDCFDNGSVHNLLKKKLLVDVNNCRVSFNAFATTNSSVVVLCCTKASYEGRCYSLGSGNRPCRNCHSEYRGETVTKNRRINSTRLGEREVSRASLGLENEKRDQHLSPAEVSVKYKQHQHTITISFFLYNISSSISPNISVDGVRINVSFIRCLIFCLVDLVTCCF